MGALGCVGMRLAEGTIVCCLAPKNSCQARRSSADVRGAISGFMLERRGRPALSGWHRSGAELGPKLCLALPHGAAPLGHGIPHAAAEAADRRGRLGLDLLGGVAAHRAQDAAPDPHGAAE